jgi:multisubunit Na+/H+ antiporter MnhE subunit
MKPLLSTAGLWLGLLLLWLILVSQITGSELIAGAAASGFALVGIKASLRSLPLCFKPRLRWLAQVWRLPAIVARDLLVVAKALGRHVTGKPSQSAFEVVRFRVTGEDCHASAKEALGILFMSTPPNTVALDIDRQSSQMLIHRLGEAAVETLVGESQE